MKQMEFKNTILVLLILAVTISGCGEVKTPSRDQIPNIKEQFFKLQQGIYNKDLAVIDSVMHVDILEKKLTSDSLLRIVYGQNYDNSFKTFSQPEIVYTDDFARIESSLIDSTSIEGRPVTFTFSSETGQWLLIEFKTGHSEKSNE